MIERTSVNIGDRRLTIEVGKMAKQADGAAYVGYGDTVVLVTSCSEKEPREDLDFLPLTVDYREYTYAAGKIPGGFFKREGKPTEKEVLTSRLIDRPIRPLFPEGYNCETQIIALVLSADTENNPDVIGITGASAALYLSPIPFTTPIAAVRVGLVDEKFLINPTYEQLKQSKMNLVVAGSEEAIVMVEAGADEISEETMVNALDFGHQAIKQIVAVQKELYERLGIKKRAFVKKELNSEFYTQLEEKYSASINEALHIPGKLASYSKLDEIKNSIVEAIPEEQEEQRAQARQVFTQLLEKVFRHEILELRKRPDARAFDEVRPISCEVSLLPRTHGSALFTRGETQALVTVTLGTAEDEQRLDALEGDTSKRFMLHYNFPPFSVGEVSMLRAPGRREIGHGALAERAIVSVIPPEDQFPYTIRIVSDILESNGSSSMASICGGILALMDSGVPIKAPVAGVAMGLVKEDDEYAILTDIAGAEDHYGDMDFKVAGTEKGITALQMDIKIRGVTRQILTEALEQAKRGRLHILNKMLETIPAPRKELSAYAPRIITIQIPTNKIGEVIGTGGKTIRGIVEQTGAKIDIQDDGRVSIASVDAESAQKAIKIIEGLTEQAELGKVYSGRVVRIADFGAFVEIFPGTDGLLHISEIANHRVKSVHDELKPNQQILVKVIDIDDQGKIRLSRKALLRDQTEEPRERSGDRRREGPRKESRPTTRRY